MSHTPGPWMEGERHESKVEIYSVIGPICRVLAPVPFVGREPMSANASLIAAAPDLLAALKRLQEAHWEIVKDERDDSSVGIFGWGTEHELNAEARAAIAKAEGK